MNHPNPSSSTVAEDASIPRSGVSLYSGYVTHEVVNQVPPLLDYDASDDAALIEGLRREGAGWYEADLQRLGRLAGSQEAQLWAVEANTYEPVLQTHDRSGQRLDEVVYHPSWHKLMDVAIREGMGGGPWADSRVGAHVARAAGSYVWQHTESGHACPVVMSYAVVPTLRFNPELAAVYEPLITNRVYDPGLTKPPAKKRGVLAAMGMTEKQGGSDVRTNSTIATPTREPGMFSLRGHKWFTSAPMCDLVFVLAQSPGGLSCFMVPRVLPDGTRNPFRIQRLKDKLGNRSNASSEPELDGSLGWLIGEEGRGVRTIIEMVNSTRLWCVEGSASIMRQGLLQATHHARYRSAFGGRLLDKPLMRNVLADLALESEAATTLTLRLAGAADRGIAGDVRESSFRRIATALSKYWVCKRASPFIAEALECLGGNGYVEESVLPRLHREAPLNSIWEGCGNVNALDVFRALHKDRGALQALTGELNLARGGDARFAAHVDKVTADLTHNEDGEGSARRAVERTALALQASLLIRFAPAAVSDAFCATRLYGDWGHAFGTLPASVDTAAILTRATGQAV